MTKQATEQRLIRAIRENPEDGLSRGLYADRLDDRGAKDRASLIRIHLELEAGPSRDREKKLLARYNRLLPKCRNDWQGLLGLLGVEEVHLESGLPYAIIIPVDRFLENADTLLLTAPFEALCPAITYESRVREMGRLATSPHLAQLPELNIGRRWVGNEGAKVLAGSPHLYNLKRLKLDYNNIGDRGAAALSHCEFGKLTCLDLGMNPLGARGLRALAESAHFGAEMRIRVNDFDGPYHDFQEWERQQRIGNAGRGKPRGR